MVILQVSQKVWQALARCVQEGSSRMKRDSSETKCLGFCSSVLVNQRYSFQNVSSCLCYHFVFIIFSSSGQFGVDIQETWAQIDWDFIFVFGFKPVNLNRVLKCTKMADWAFSLNATSVSFAFNVGQVPTYMDYFELLTPFCLLLTAAMLRF